MLVAAKKRTTCFPKLFCLRDFRYIFYDPLQAKGGALRVHSGCTAVKNIRLPLRHHPDNELLDRFWDRETQQALISSSTPDRVVFRTIRPFQRFWDRNRGGKQCTPSGPILGAYPISRVGP
jgi:hypothetical protein